METKKIFFSGIKSMLGRDEMRKIKAGSACSQQGVACNGVCADPRCYCHYTIIASEYYYTYCGN